MSAIRKAQRAAAAVNAQLQDFLADAKVRRRLASKYPALPEKIDCIVYFGDGLENLYQVRQWLGPMADLAAHLSVVLLARRPLAAQELLNDSPIPIVLAKGVFQVEEFVRQHGVKAIFYVNNSQANFTVLRQTDPLHIHLSHGESDKVSMASNQLKAYDYVFVAAQAARERILTSVKRIDPAKLVEIGRPQIDHMRLSPSSTRDGRITVLYAPTWEGDRPEMAYGSVLSHGPGISSALLNDSNFRLIFRPHPLTGTRIPHQNRAVREITRAVELANRNDPTAGHYVDRRPDFYAAMGEADVSITDISAMAFDWLSQRKPLLLTLPTEHRATVEHSELPKVVPMIQASEADKVTEKISLICAHPLTAEQHRLIERHFGDTTPGKSSDRFVKAVRDIVAQEERSSTDSNGLP